MLLAEAPLQYRLSRSDLTQQRALRRILRSEERMRRLFGQETYAKERRREPRQTLKVPVNLRSALVKGLSIYVHEDEQPFLALTSNISLSGLGIVHDRPLPAQVFLVEFDVSEEEPLSLLVEACWTARPFPQSYRTGGRIRGVARLP